MSKRWRGRYRAARRAFSPLDTQPTPTCPWSFCTLTDIWCGKGTESTAGSLCCATAGVAVMSDSATTCAPSGSVSKPRSTRSTMLSTGCVATPIRHPVQSGEVLPIASGVTMPSGCSRGGTIPYGPRHAFAPSRQQPAAFTGPSPSARRGAERPYISAKAHPGPLRRLKGGTAAPPRVGGWPYRGRRRWKGLGFRRGTYRPAVGARIRRRSCHEPPRSRQYMAFQ
jgi:hypothetical protein